MLCQVKLAAAMLAVGVACGGGCCAVQCGNGCNAGSPYAFQQYDCACESCGAGWCGGGQGGCGCGGGVACGDGCRCGDARTSGDGCANGRCGCQSGGGRCGCKSGGACGCGKCGDGCHRCGRPTPCWVLNLFCRCAGCGEWYWNEWYNDPPRCAEPCDCYGNWIGPGSVGNYRAPYRSEMGWTVGQAPRNGGGVQATNQDGDESNQAAGNDAGRPANVTVDEGLDAAVYDDGDLVPELQ